MRVSKVCGAGVLVCIAGVARAEPPPLFADWSVRFAGPDTNKGEKFCSDTQPYKYHGPNVLTELYHPGGTSGLEADHVFIECHYKRLYEAGAPIGVVVKNCTSPLPYGECAIESPWTLDRTIQSVRKANGRLDYVVMDVEGTHEQNITNILEVVSRVRSHHDDRIADANIGNYGWSATRWDAAMSFPHGSDKTEIADDYLASGMNISMPSCYAYSYYRLHAEVRTRRTIEGWMGGWDPKYEPFAQTCPNIRAALFWAPLERLSASAREMPEDHMLMPWFARLIAWKNYPIEQHEMPTLDDGAALAMHARLRGASGFFTFPSAYEAEFDGHDPIRLDPGTDTQEDYQRALLGGWDSLETDFQSSAARDVMTLENPKTDGVFVSATRFGDEAVVLISNMTDGPIDVDINERLNAQFEGDGVIESSPWTHELYRVRLDAAIRDFDGDGQLTRIDRAYGINAIRRTTRGDKPPSDIEDIDGDGDVDALDERAVLNAVRAYGRLPDPS
ncbi:MAG: hypothetical protein AAGB51_09835 [Planctomycetota bacterium]